MALAKAIALTIIIHTENVPPMGKHSPGILLTAQAISITILVKYIIIWLLGGEVFEDG